MAYRYDIFISYKRHPETLGWIKKHFEPLLGHVVGLALGSDPTIFVHEVNQQIPAGAIWPQFLGEELGASRVLVALWTGNFFNSTWCMKEMSHMLGREGKPVPGRKYALVIPAIINDCEELEQEQKQNLTFIQSMNITSCYNPRMRKDSEKAEELFDLVSVHAKGIAQAIRDAPEWKPAWPQVAADGFFAEIYRAAARVQSKLPRFHPA